MMARARMYLPDIDGSNSAKAVVSLLNEKWPLLITERPFFYFNQPANVY
jgi:hypothetical protein